MAFSEKTVKRILEYQSTKKAWTDQDFHSDMDESDRLRVLYEEAKGALASWVATEFKYPEEKDA